MVKTYGLTHLALAVRDVTRASRFYERVFGSTVVYQSEAFVQLQTPGARDVLVLERKKGAQIGKSAGIAHFGYRLTRPQDIGRAARAVKAAGGKILSRGEFVPGEPYLFARDPDGYELEIWYEIPTPVDPKTKRATTKKKSRRVATAAADSKQ